MESCYLGNHIAEDHIHMNITACKIEETQLYFLLVMMVKKHTQSYRYILPKSRSTIF